MGTNFQAALARYEPTSDCLAFIARDARADGAERQIALDHKQILISRRIRVRRLLQGTADFLGPRAQLNLIAFSLAGGDSRIIRLGGRLELRQMGRLCGQVGGLVDALFITCR